MTSSATPRLLLAATLFAAAAAVAPAAAAGTDTDVLTVRVTVQEACTIAGGTLDFGTYNSGQTTAQDAEGSVSFANCAAGTLQIGLDGGTAASVNNRRMSNGDSQLNYQLFRNSARTAIWGTGEQALQQVLLQPDSGSIPVYGRIAAGQSVPAGNYVDTVTVTLTF